MFLKICKVLFLNLRGGFEAVTAKDLPQLLELGLLLLQATCAWHMQQIQMKGCSWVGVIHLDIQGKT